MAITKIAEVTVGAGGAASIDFTGIAGTATDLMLFLSGRSSNATNTTYARTRINGDTTSANYTYKALEGDGGSVTSFGGNDSGIYTVLPGDSATSSTFGSVSIYIANYTASTAKSISVDAATENNAGSGFVLLGIGATKWSGTAAITSLSIVPVGSPTNTFKQYSTASLYSITKGSGGASVS